MVDTVMVMNKPDRCCSHLCSSSLKVLNICEILHLHKILLVFLVTIIHM